MSLHFHALTIKKIQKETPDCVSITFSMPEDLKDLFAFQQGQSLTMRTTINGEEVRRTYSLCSCPQEGEWKVAVKKVDGGLFSTLANERLKAGDQLDVMPPIGKFNTPLDPAANKKYVFFAAGSGITPVISIIKSVLRTEPGSHCTLIYGNRSRASIIFFEELEGLKDKYLNRFQLIHILSRERTDTAITSGRIDLEKLKTLQNLIHYAGTDAFFLCGPEEMIFTVKDFLENIGVDKKKIHFELFTTAGSRKKQSQASLAKEDSSGPMSTITLQVDGRSFDFQHPLQSEISLLDAALKQGADLPFACKGGVCCTCKAKLVAGEVSMDVHWGLEDFEVEQGYILTCQSHPKSEKVVIDFDKR